MTNQDFVALYLGQSMPRGQIPQLSFAEFRRTILEAVAGGQRVAALFGDGNVDLYAILSDSRRSRLRIGMTTLAGDHFPSLTPVCPQVHLFEREIAEQYGVRPEGHPWFKPVRFHRSYRPGHDAWGRKPSEDVVAGVTDYFRVGGEEIHEVAVGPVHAGVIEPGHFRFQCHGEQVFHLEISLGYQHRGAERTLAGGRTSEPFTRWRPWLETRRLATRRPTARQWKRWPAVRYPFVPRCCAAWPWSSNAWPTIPATWEHWPATLVFCRRPPIAGRLRGDFLNLTALLCGSRFGRVWCGRRSRLRPGR